MTEVEYSVIDIPSQSARIATFKTRDEAEVHARDLNDEWWRELFYVMAFVLFVLYGFKEPYAVVEDRVDWPDVDVEPDEE